MGILPITPWSEMFPNGRTVFYEGKYPNVFAKEIKDKYGFDPREGNPSWNKRSGYQFRCPAKHLDEIYGSGKYPLGS